MRVLVTGATGFLGGHVVADLRARGHEVVALGRDHGRLEAIGGARVRADIRDPAALLAACQGIEAVVHAAFPKTEITTQVDQKRQGIVDSWPADVDDSAARADWGHAPTFGFAGAFGEYLIPSIKKRYSGG